MQRCLSLKRKKCIFSIFPDFSFFLLIRRDIIFRSRVTLTLSGGSPQDSASQRIVSMSTSPSLASSATTVVVSMEMCVQNLYPRRSPELPENSRKALVELRATKERLRCESFPTLPPPPPVFRPTNPFFRRRFPRESRAGAMYPGLQVQENEFPRRKYRGNGYIRALPRVPPRPRTTRATLRRHSRIYILL